MANDLKLPKPPLSVEDFLRDRKPFRDIAREIKKRLTRLGSKPN